MGFITEAEVEMRVCRRSVFKTISKTNCGFRAGCVFVALWLSSSIHSVWASFTFGSKPNSNTKRKKSQKSPQILFIKIISILLEVSGSLYFPVGVEINNMLSIPGDFLCFAFSARSRVYLILDPALMGIALDFPIILFHCQPLKPVDSPWWAMYSLTKAIDLAGVSEKLRVMLQ